MPHRRRDRGPHRGRRRSRGCSATSPATSGRHRARASSGWPTTPSGARPPTTRRRAGAPIVATGARHAAAQPRPTPPPARRRRRPAANAVNVRDPRAGDAQVVGEPKLKLTYSGTGSPPDARVRADRRRGGTSCRQPGDADPGHAGRRCRTPSRARSRRSSPRAKGAALHAAVTAARLRPVPRCGVDQFSSIRLTLPTATGFGGRGASAACSVVAPVPLAPALRDPPQARARQSRLRSARVWVEGKRVKVRPPAGRLPAVVDLRGRTKRRVSVRTRSTRGHDVRDTRSYHTCAKKRR